MQLEPQTMCTCTCMAIYTLASFHTKLLMNFFPLNVLTLVHWTRSYYANASTLVFINVSLF